MTNCPQVLTLLLPRCPEEIMDFLTHVWALDKKIGWDHPSRDEISMGNTKNAASGEEPLKDFQAGLELKVKMSPINPSQAGIAARLTDRINHFNLSTIVRSEAEIADLSKQRDTETWGIDVSDRFGDYGITGVAITQKENDYLFIDTFLLSCTVLGKTVENAVLLGLKKYCEKNNAAVLKACFFPTKKNQIFLEFLDKTHWEKVKETGDGITFALGINKIPCSIDYIDCEFKIG